MYTSIDGAMYKKRYIIIQCTTYPTYSCTDGQRSAKMYLREFPVFFSEKMGYEVRKSSKKISAMLLSFASREKGESHDRSQKDVVQAGVARCLKQSSDWFKRTPSRFEMRV